MKSTLFSLIILATASLCFGPTAWAWDEPPEGILVDVFSECSGDDILLSVDFILTAEPPAESTGWVIKRKYLGLCAGHEVATEVMDWPELGESHFDLTITPEYGTFDILFDVYAVGDDGFEAMVDMPYRKVFAHAECRPGPTVIGTFEDQGGHLVFISCSESCYPELSPWDGTFPEGAEELADTGTLMALYGELLNGMEGYYLNQPTMEPSMFPCGWVSTQRTSWGSMKSQYR